MRNDECHMPWQFDKCAEGCICQDAHTASKDTPYATELSRDSTLETPREAIVIATPGEGQDVPKPEVKVSDCCRGDPCWWEKMHPWSDGD